MTPEKQRIAIAEACGWKREQVADELCNCTFEAWRRGTRRLVSPDALPDYLNDLNAIHDAEHVLAAGYWDRYAQWLRELTHSNRRFLIAHATAAQRAEAFLKTIGRWE